MKFVFTCAKRIDSRLIYTDDKQLFKTRDLREGILRYACYRENCKAKVIVNTFEITCTPAPKFEQHNHDDNQEELYKQCKAAKDLKLKCQADKSSSLTEIFESTPGSSQLLFQKMKSAMKHNRRKTMPCNPTSAASAAIFFEDDAVKEIFPRGQDDMILHRFVSTERYSFVVFSSTKILGTLPELRWFQVSSSMRVLADCFFKVFLTLAIVKDTEVRMQLFPKNEK